MRKEEILNLLEEDVIKEEQNILDDAKKLINIGKLQGIAPRILDLERWPYGTKK